MHCASCGAENKGSAKFCIKCGADLKLQRDEQGNLVVPLPVELSGVQGSAEVEKRRPRRGRAVLLGLFAVVGIVAVLAVAAWAVYSRIWATERRADLTALLGPGTTANVTLEELRSLAELATAEYRVVAEVQSERVPDDIRRHLGVKEEVLMLVYADVKAGLDLDELTEGSLKVNGPNVEVVLPAAKILSVTLDHERTHVVYYKKSLLTSYDIEWVDETLQRADQAIRQEALDLGILEKAEKFGIAYFENHLRALGFTEVKIEVQ